MRTVVAEPDTVLRSVRATGRESRNTMGTDGGAIQLTLGDRAALAVEAYRVGVHEPFTDVVTEITPLLWHVVRAQNVPRDLAEDVVQGVWLAFVLNAGTLRDPQGAVPEESHLTNERDRVLWRNVRELPERCQEMLRIMAFADRPSYRDIAEAVGMGVTSVGATRGRCLDKLRTLLESDAGWGSHD